MLRHLLHELQVLQVFLPAFTASACEGYVILSRLWIGRSHLQPGLWKERAALLEMNGPN
jgi:hypothetical protein